jgi:hypothetical protein
MGEGDHPSGSSWQLERCLPFHLIGEIPIAERSADSTTDTGPSESEWKGDGARAGLRHRKIIVVRDVAQMRALYVKPDLKLGSLEAEIVGVFDLYYQIEVASSEANAAHDCVVELNLGFSEVVTNAATGGAE